MEVGFRFTSGDARGYSEILEASDSQVRPQIRIFAIWTSHTLLENQR